MNQYLTSLLIALSAISAYGLGEIDDNRASVEVTLQEQTLEYYAKKREEATKIFNLGKYRQCKNLLLKDLSKVETEDIPLNEAAEWYYLLGKVFRGLTIKDSAELYLQKSLEASLKIDSTSLFIAKIYNQYGDLYNVTYEIDLSNEYVHKSMKFLNEYHPLEEMELSNAKFILARNVLYKRDFELALFYFKERENFLKRKFGQENKYLASLYWQMSSIHSKKGDINNMKIFAELANKNASKYYDEIHPIAISCRQILAMYYGRSKQYNKSLELYKKGLKSIMTINGEQHKSIAVDYNNIAANYFYLKDFENSLKYRKKALKVYIEVLGEKSPKVALMYANMSADYIGMGNKPDSVFYSIYQLIEHNVLEVDSITSVASISKIKVENVLDMNLFIQSITHLASNLYVINQNIDNAHAAYELFEYCEKLVDIIYASHFSDQDKISFNKRLLYIYSEAIVVCNYLYEKTCDIKYLDKAFNYSEKTKAGLITNNRLKSRGEDFLNDSKETEYEDSLKNVLQKLYTDLRNEKVKKQQNDSIIAVYNNKVSNAILKLEQLSHEDKFNEMYATQSKKIYTQQIQNNLKKGQALIEYFTPDRWYAKDTVIYAFVISKDTAAFLILENKNLNTSIDSLRKVIQSNVPEYSPQKYYNDYVKHANYLYKALLEKSLETLVGDTTLNHLIVILDNIISYVPFELLLTEKTSNHGTDYSHLNYLIKDYAISYDYSFSLRAANNSLDDSNHSKSNYLGYAPSYQDFTTDTSELVSLGRFRDAIIPLKWNTEEVNNISKTTNGLAITGKEASESNFKSRVNDYKVVHLAMHGFIDDKDPMNSKLVFTREEDSLEDGFLHTYELFNMHLTPELIVLSACETGYGELTKGEGMLSLAYGFAYAGCPSLVASQWQVNDKSTSELMQSFYKYLNDGESKHEALRKAKLDFLSSADRNFANPFFWGGFILIGDTKSIDFDNYNRMYWYASVGIICFVILTLFMRSRKKKSNA